MGDKNAGCRNCGKKIKVDKASNGDNLYNDCDMFC